MSYRLIDFLNSDDAMLFTILAKNLKEKYACVCKVRLSEFLYSTQQEGSKEFYDEFQTVNLITVPFAIFDVTTGKLSATVFFNKNGFDGEKLLEIKGIPCIGISEFKDVLISDSLSCFMV
ncbi:DNA distortion polypeptide 3 [Klebsiella pneumoniae]|uniref:DNA distortion polypeptide 3 n=1 Tax=Klebsiella pneumoniae TaxID=573 RepID=UPI00175372B8|nr:DNA distortion polypeptide 3 [Klebsiella pneumoniae]EJZ6203250.1 hypothetical protein [Escherichia coli]EKP2270698.1 hypothetical protein [Escherichia coli]EME2574704.1 hypothetical protein [Escherichia coli]MBM0423908.1 hypothetical protein [Klebsiella pneumoniae]MBM0543526.1 hypothetical protein [Klebsiella pneumoniae]